LIFLNSTRLHQGLCSWGIVAVFAFVPIAIAALQLKTENEK
jgi:hypothetical protein